MSSDGKSGIAKTKDAWAGLPSWVRAVVALVTLAGSTTGGGYLAGRTAKEPSGYSEVAKHSAEVPLMADRLASVRAKLDAHISRHADLLTDLRVMGATITAQAKQIEGLQAEIRAVTATLNRLLGAIEGLNDRAEKLLERRR